MHFSLRLIYLAVMIVSAVAIPVFDVDGSNHKSLSKTDLDFQKKREADAEDKTLVQIQMIFRHGIRTSWDFWPDSEDEKPVWPPSLTELHPDITLPSFQVQNISTGEVIEDPWDKDASLLKGGAISGALSTKGMQQCFDLGKRIRNRYENEVPFTAWDFAEDSLFLFTSNFGRTRLSLAYLMAGLLIRDDESSPLIFKIDNMLIGAEIENPQTVKDWKEFLKLNAEQLIPGCSETLGDIQSISGGDRPTTTDLRKMRDVLISWKANDLDQDPEQPQDGVLQKMLPLLDKIDAINQQIHAADYIGDRDLEDHFDVDLLPLTAKPIISRLLANMKDTSQRALFFSGHDVTLIPLLAALGLKPEENLQFAADVIIELYQDQGTEELWVQVVLRGQVVENLLDSESSMISLTTFEEKMKPFLGNE